MKILYKLSPLIVFLASGFIWFNPSKWNYFKFVGNGLFILIFVMIVTLIPSIIFFNKNKKHTKENSETIDNLEIDTKPDNSFYLTWSKLIFYIGLLLVLLLMIFVKMKLFNN